MSLRVWPVTACAIADLLLPKVVGDSSFLTARARLLPQGGANSPLRLRLRQKNFWGSAGDEPGAPGGGAGAGRVYLAGKVARIN